MDIGQGITFGQGVNITPQPPPPTYKAIFGYGRTASVSSLSNLVSNTGVVATDTTGVGTARWLLAGTGYGTDKAIFGFGSTGAAQAFGSGVSMTNLVSNTGVVATDTTGVGGARQGLAAAGYGSSGQAIFGYGVTSGSELVSYTNLVTNTGVVGNNVLTAYTGPAWQVTAATYGTDKAIFGFGTQGGIVSAGNATNKTNRVTNTGVVGGDEVGVGTARATLAATGYGSSGQVIFGYGRSTEGTVTAVTNLVSNTGVVATDTTGVGTARWGLSAARYGTDTAIFGYGTSSGTTGLSMTNLVSNTGVVATDTTGVGTARYGVAAAVYGTA